MFRVTGRNDVGEYEAGRPSVLMVHGAGMDAASWVMSSSNKGKELPLILALADTGYDVWLASSRGS